MQRPVFLHLEQILKDYPRIDKYIQSFKNSLYFSVDDEKRILTLKEQKSAVRDAIEYIDDDTLEVVNALYFAHNPNKTIDGIALDLHIAKSTLFYRRNKFLELVKRNLGW